MTEWREPSECTRRVYASQRLYPPLPLAAGGTGAKGAADRDKNPLSDREPTCALTIGGRRIPAIVGDLDATPSDGGDKGHERGWARLESSGELEPGRKKAESVDVTDLRNLEQRAGPQQRCRGPRE